MYAPLIQNMLIKQTRDYDHIPDFDSLVDVIALEL